MTKKILAVGCSGGTSMVSCLQDAEKMYDLFCVDKEYKYKWGNPPALYDGRVIAKANMTLADLIAHFEWCKDCDELVIFWSSHGSLVKYKNKNEFAFYIGNNTVILFRHFLENFLLPIYKAKKKKIRIIIDTCYSGKAKKKIRRIVSENIEDKTIVETKYIELKNPKIKKLKNSNIDKKFLKNISIISAATGNQSAFGAFDCNIEHGFIGNTNGCSLFTACLVSSITNAYAWAVGYKKRNWNYILKLTQKRSNNIVGALGLAGWLNSPPKTVAPQISTKGKKPKHVI